jgi:hypothetical protein
MLPGAEIINAPAYDVRVVVVDDKVFNTDVKRLLPPVRTGRP